MTTIKKTDQQKKLKQVSYDATLPKCIPPPMSRLTGLVMTLTFDLRR